jgi:hypothetical protein
VRGGALWGLVRLCRLTGHVPPLGRLYAWRLPAARCGGPIRHVELYTIRRDLVEYEWVGVDVDMVSRF